MQMLTKNKLISAGLIALPWFAFWVVLLDMLRPEYDYRYKAVSELGAIGAPYMLTMNIFGFTGTGLLLLAFSLGYSSLLKHQAAGKRLLLITALLFIGTAIPISMDTSTDPDPDLNAWNTIVHTVCSLVGYLVWLVALIFIAIRKNGNIKRISLITLALVIVLFTLGSIYFSDKPGLMQRLNFLILLSWYFKMALTLLTKTR